MTNDRREMRSGISPFRDVSQESGVPCRVCVCLSVCVRVCVGVARQTTTEKNNTASIYGSALLNQQPGTGHSRSVTISMSDIADRSTCFFVSGCEQRKCWNKACGSHCTNPTISFDVSGVFSHRCSLKMIRSPWGLFTDQNNHMKTSNSLNKHN